MSEKQGGLLISEPEEGLLTFRTEGLNVPDSFWYSSKVHWPGKRNECQKWKSGVTIGRGYDLGKRSKDAILRDLLHAGLPEMQAKKIAEGAKKTRCMADKFVRKYREDIGEFTEIQQIRLF